MPIAGSSGYAAKPGCLETEETRSLCKRLGDAQRACHHATLLHTSPSNFCCEPCLRQSCHREGHILTSEFRISRSRAVLGIHKRKAIISLSRQQGRRCVDPISARIPLLLVLRARSSRSAFCPTVVSYLAGPYSSNSLYSFTPLLDIARRLATGLHKRVYQYLGSLQ